MMAAYARGLGDLGMTRVPNFRDAAAAQLLSGMFWRVLFRRARRVLSKQGARRERLISDLDAILLRVAFIDRVIVERAPRQVVILGAGLDTRAWRLPTLAGASLFEVDHPATQAYKRERAHSLGAPHATPRYVALDFRRDRLGAALRAAGHDAAIATTWIWEGVIMYLDDAALRGTLAEIRAASGPGSRLVAHYYEPPEREGFWRRLLRRTVLSWFGEPWIGVRRREVMHAELREAGFELAQDADLEQQAAAVGAPPPGPTRAGVSHVVVASVLPLLAAEGGSALA
jgi:methyltransferase (TIGR00027 family)